MAFRERLTRRQPSVRLHGERKCDGHPVLLRCLRDANRFVDVIHRERGYDVGSGSRERLDLAGVIIAGSRRAHAAIPDIAVAARTDVPAHHNGFVRHRVVVAELCSAKRSRPHLGVLNVEN